MFVGAGVNYEPFPGSGVMPLPGILHSLKLYFKCCIDVMGCLYRCKEQHIRGLN